MKRLEILSIIILITVAITSLILFLSQTFSIDSSYASTTSSVSTLPNAVSTSKKQTNTKSSEPAKNSLIEEKPILIALEPEEPEPLKPTYYIRVNVASNTVTIYGQDENKDYTIPVRACICSTGTATPHFGIYATPHKFLWLELLGSVYGQYCTQIVGDILFHSVPYRKEYDKGSLIYSYYDRLGTSASAGCIRLTVEDAKWIYDNCELGTNVEFYDDANNPGPLGKPTAQKISGNTALRNWDPTDPDENNPWKN